MASMARQRSRGPPVPAPSHPGATMARQLPPMRSSFMTTRRRLLALSIAVVAAAAAPLGAWAAAAPAPALSAADQALVDKAVAYLQGLNEARGRFIQSDGRGAPTQGDLFLK